MRKHVGDFTLFFTGLFPESVARLPTLRTFSCDKFVDYMRAGNATDTFAAAVVERLGARIANVEATAWQAERSAPIASARLNFLLKPRAQ